MPTLPRWLVAFGPALAYMLLIFVLSSFPIQLDLERVPFRDKGVHFVEYGTLGALLAHALRATYPRARALWMWLLAAFATVLWGALDEIHQAYVPGRNSDTGDLIADAVGAVFGAALYLIFHQRRAARALPTTRASEPQ